jgi:hypothetical protein
MLAAYSRNHYSMVEFPMRKFRFYPCVSVFIRYIVGLPLHLQTDFDGHL